MFIDYILQTWQDQEIGNFMVTIKNINVTAGLSRHTVVVLCSIDAVHVVKRQFLNSGYSKVDIAYYHEENATSGKYAYLFYLNRSVHNLFQYEKSTKIQKMLS